MDFGLHSSWNRQQNPEAAAWSDITSFLIKRQRGSNLGITLQGFIVRPAPATTKSDFHAAYADTIAFDEDVLREIFATAHAVSAPAPELEPESQLKDTQTEGGMEDINFQFNTDVDFAELMENFAQAEEASLPHSTETSFQSSDELCDALELSPSPGFATSPASDIPDRHACSVCTAAFKRPSDLKRHSRVHSPETRTFHCREPHCGRNGSRGFYRRDKLVQHQRQVHDL